MFQFLNQHSFVLAGLFVLFITAIILLRRHARKGWLIWGGLAVVLGAGDRTVLDARRAIAWLASQGYESIGIIGTSLGSCLSMLTTAHEPLIRAAALNHISPYFADVIWEGLSTSHVRQGLDGNVDLDRLRRMWLPTKEGAAL